jgi:MoaA/NifB/PqqE/SkfB family radical SAM enzyme
MAATCATLAPILQVHPTRRCNLRCLHCYSNSAPEERDTLEYQLLEDLLTDARAQGYLTASFSGGEPVLYSKLANLLRHAKSLGMRTTVTSNGMLLNVARLTPLVGYTDVLAISLDGIPESHDRMRASPGAFDAMVTNLDRVRASKINFGFIFTLTQFNVHEAAWAAEFALAQGAKLFQIHPLEVVGRATEKLTDAAPDELESAYAYLEAERIRQAYGDRLFVQVDLFHRDLVVRYPGVFHADDHPPASGQLADYANPLVLEADGTLLPYGYGFSRKFAVGSIRDQPLTRLAPAWIRDVYPDFRALCRRVYEEACRPSDLPFLNWYEMIHLRSLEASELQKRTFNAPLPGSAA